MKITELARESGFSVSTLYDYLKSGLLPRPEKESPTKAHFTERHCSRLDDIRKMKAQGLPMAEIKSRLIVSTATENAGRAPSDEIRVAIIDKALELFSIHHYENTKISDIAQALNMGNGTFYRYFKSKEELFLDCLERLPKVLVPRDAWDEVEKESDYIQRLKKRGYAMLNAFPSYIGILNYAKLALGGTDRKLAGKAAECIRSLVRPLKEDLKQAVSQGHVREVDVTLCAHLLLGINETFGYLLLMNPDLSVENEFGIIEDFISHALMKIPVATASPIAAELTDRSGNTLRLAAFHIAQGKQLSGQYLDGELHVKLNRIDCLEMDDTGTSLICRLSLTTGETIEVTIHPEIDFCGCTPFGDFHIKARKVKLVRFIQDRNPK